MKTGKILVFTLAIITLTVTGCSQRKAVEGTTQGQIDSVSYAMGINFGYSLVQAGMDVIDFDVMLTAVHDVIEGKELRFDRAEAEVIIRSFMAIRREFMEKKNLEEGTKFLEDNKKNVDVVELPNGLQYKIITQGEGAKPAAQDTVKVHYRGTTVDGKEFDSSYKNNEPAIFPLDRVIAGWTEGLQELNEGTKAMLYIPTEMAYGARGSRTIAPNAVLIFEVELLEVRPAQPETTENNHKQQKTNRKLYDYGT